MKTQLSNSNFFKKYFHQYFELAFWLAALLLLFFMNTDEAAASVCFFKFIGFQRCPGCGLGHAIHDALHLRLAASFGHHPLGIVAVIIILNRIKQLSFKPKPAIQ